MPDITLKISTVQNTKLKLTAVTGDETLANLWGLANDTAKSTFGATLDWDDQVALLGRGSAYPQPTGQEISYRTNDDADIEATVFAPVRAANGLKAINSLSSFLVLNNNNSWGNTNRFTAEDGTQTYTANLVLDNLTGLMWYRVLQASANWNDAIDAALASTQGGFEDWFLPSVSQIHTIADFENSKFTNYSPFSFTSNLHTSSTDVDTTANDWLARMTTSHTAGMYDSNAKIAAISYIICRKHF